MKRSLGLLLVGFVYGLSSLAQPNIGGIKRAIKAPAVTAAGINSLSSRLYSESDGALYTTAEAPSSDLHKNNLDKILFAKARVNKDGDASQLSSVFHSGEAIYGRAFMRSCMMNYKVYGHASTGAHKCMDGRFVVNISIDGQDKGLFMTNTIDGELESKSTFTIIVLGSGDDAQANNEQFINTLNSLSAGNHTIKLVVWAIQGQFTSNEPVASGEFTYVKDAGTGKTGLGRSFGSVKDEMPDNAALKAKCLKKLNDHAKANGWKETFTEVKISDEDWTTERNERTSVITGRRINITAKATSPDGYCTYQTFSMRSEYDGTSYSNAVAVYGVGEQVKIDCK
jgi:hypothetical protein